MLGGFLALLAAITFALNNASVRRGVLSGSIAQAMAITVPMGVPLFLILTIAAGSLGMVLGFSSDVMLALALAGIIHFVAGRYCNFRATRAMGANLVGPVQQVSLVLTLALAIVALGERLTPLRIVGILLVVLGPMLTMRGDAEKRSPPPRVTDQAEGVVDNESDQLPPFAVNYAEGVIFALLSAVAYGTSPILIRYGLNSKDLGTSLAGGLISYIAATAIILPLLLWPGSLRHVRAIEPEAAKWFTISGVMVCLSQMFIYMGFALAPVSVVSPIQRLSIVFRIYFGHVINPQHEVFGANVYLGTIISLVGALALSLSTDVVLLYIALPDWAVGIARWQWP